MIEQDLLAYEKELNMKGVEFIAGVDEVGRGPLFGPVVTAAVILPKGYKLDGLTDSKKLTSRKRDSFYDIIMKDAVSVSIGIKGPEVIDEVNIYEATKLAMMEAIEGLDVRPEHVLIDAMKLEKLDIPSTSIIKGDAKSESIAAASVIAKVTRDRMMDEVALKYPEYGFDSHKGYPTKGHVEALYKYGLIDGYRKTFEPVKSIINGSVYYGKKEKKARKRKVERPKVDA